MPLYFHSKPLGQLDYISGGRDSLEIARDGVISRLNLRIQYTVTNGASAAVGPLWQALARILRRVEIVINGRDTIYSIDGPGLISRAIYEMGEVPYGADATVVLTGEAETTYDLVVPIPFFLPRSASPYITALPADRFGQVTLHVTWAPSDCSQMYGTPNSAAISAVSCWVEGEYFVGLPAGTNFLTCVLDQVEYPVTADSSAFNMTMDTGTGLKYRSFHVVALDDDVASDAIIDELTVQSGTQVFQKRSNVFLQAANLINHMQADHQTGVYFLPTEQAGRPDMWIDTARETLAADLLLSADLDLGSGTTKLVVYREAVRPFK